jgi:hypothetical protein
MSGLAIDLQELPKALDTIDADNDVDRQLQGCRNLAAGIASVLRAIGSTGTGKFVHPLHVSAVNQATYETDISNGMSAVTDLLSALTS